MTQGRWPTNVILAPHMAVILDQQSGVSKSPTGAVTRGRGSILSREVQAAHGYRPQGDAYANEENPGTGIGYGDSGGVSRYFLEAWYEPEELAWIYKVGLTPYTGQE